ADPQDFAGNPGKFDIPDSVIGFLSGELGDPPGGWPEPFRTRALAGRTARALDTDLTEAQAEGLLRSRRRTLDRLLFPGPTREFEESRATYGDLSVLGTAEYLYGLQPGKEHGVTIEEGKTLLLGLQSVGEPDKRGIRTVMCTINGQLRPIPVRDRSVEPDAPAAEKADPSRPGDVAAPFGGSVTPVVRVGDQVAAGDVVAKIEAMKMEASITTPVAGTVTRIALAGTAQVDGGDLIMAIA
ncbi:MAG: biotin/lipoyl-containing protein, partial [Trebonia sp.]